MGKDTSISWTHHTFNPWWGCEKVSPACAHCYAETFAKRIGHAKDSPSGKPPLWGAGSERRLFGDKHWNEPLKWNREAAAAGERRRVFCASMADVFEDRADLVPHRARLFELIRRTPNLDWLLLTKRPENVPQHFESALKWLYTLNKPHSVNPAAHHAWHDAMNLLEGWTTNSAPENVWIGTTVENQEMAEKRIPALLAIPAKVRFLSCEPLLGPVDLAYTCFNGADSFGTMPGIHWVICGGESGHHARPMHPDWARSLRSQCAAAGVPFHFKQWGEWVPVCAQYPKSDAEFDESENAGMCGQIALEYNGVIAEGYQPVSKRAWLMDRVGTTRAGRLLDGALHDDFPTV